jgi:hypothetical protein
VQDNHILGLEAASETGIPVRMRIDCLAGLCFEQVCHV